MRVSGRRSPTELALPLAGAALFAGLWGLFWTLPKWSAPLMNYEWDGFLAARSWARGLGPLNYADSSPYFIHPPLYLFLLSRALRTFGETLMTARALGWAFLIGQAVLVALLALRVAPPAPAERGAGRPGYWGLAIGLFLCCPAALQGVLLTDIASDNSLLAFCLLATLAAWIGRASRLDSGTFALWTLCFGFSFWAKPTTTLALPAAFLLLASANGTRRPAVLGLAAAAAGFALFVLTFRLYCVVSGYADYFAVPFQVFTHDVGVRAAAAGRGTVMAVEALRAALWISPFWVVLFAVELGRAVRERGRDADVDALRAFAGVVGVGYTLLASHTTAGCFKYAAPALPVLCVLLARSQAGDLKSRLSGRPGLILGLVLAAGTAWDFCLVGDPLYTVNRVLREAQALGTVPVRSVLGELGLQLLCSTVPAAVLLGLLGRRRWAAALLLAGVCWNLSLDFRQRGAAYLTGTGYGSDGFEPAVRLVQERFGGERVLARADLVSLLEPQPADPLDGERAMTHNDEAGIQRALREGRPRFFVFGLGSNTVDQVRRFALGADFREALKGYRETRLGDYWVYERGS